MHSDLKSKKEQKSTLGIELQKQKEKINTIHKSQVKRANTKLFIRAKDSYGWFSKDTTRSVRQSNYSNY